MRKILLLLTFLTGCAALAQAQNSNVTATVQDANSNPYANGTYSITFSGPSSALANGNTFNRGPFTGSLNGSGLFTVTLTDNGSIQPSGTQWTFYICGSLGIPCFRSTITVSGQNPNLSATLSASAPILSQWIPLPVQAGTHPILPTFSPITTPDVTQSNPSQAAPLSIVTDSGGKALAAILANGNIIGTGFFTVSNSTGTLSPVTGTGTVTSSGGPVSGNIAAFSTSTNLVPATVGNVTALFTGCSGTQYLGFDGACHTAGGSVTSAGLSVPSWLSVTGSPITTTGTFSVTAATGQTSHQVIGTCGNSTSFSPCSLVAADLPSISLTTGVTGILPLANGGTNASAAAQAALNILGTTTTNFVLTYNGTNWVGAAAPGAGSVAIGSPIPAASEVTAWQSPSAIVGYTGFVTDTAGNTTHNSVTTNGAIPLSGAPNSLGGISFPIPASNPTSTTCAVSTNYLLGGTNALYFCTAGASAPVQLTAAVPVNVAASAPASTTFNQACTLNFTNASNVVVASSSNCFNPGNIGAILEFNKNGSAANCPAAVVALTPCFRAVITGVSGVNITLGAGGYFPDTTTNNVPYAAGPTIGTYQLKSDICSQSNAAIFNNGSGRTDAGAVPSSSCTINPWNGLNYSITSGYGPLQWGTGITTIDTQIFVPSQTSFLGTGKGQSNGTANTYLSADTGTNGYAPQTFSANAIPSANFTTTAGTSTWQDQTAAGSCTGNNAVSYSASRNCSQLIAVVASAACIGSTQYGQFQLAWAIAGFKESSQISFTNVPGWVNSSGGAQNGFGTSSLVAVSGTHGIVQFNTTCSAPTVTASGAGCTVTTFTSCSSANLAVNNDVLAKNTITPAGTVSGSGQNATLTDTSGDFIAADGMNSQITCLTNCGGNPGPYTIIQENSSTSINILNSTSITWTAPATFTITRWIYSETLNIDLNGGTAPTFLGFNSSTQTVIFDTVLPMQNTMPAGSTPTYYVGGPMLNFMNFTVNPNGNSIQGTSIKDMTINCNSIFGCGTLSADAGQEAGTISGLGLSGWTTYAIRCENNCAHNGPWSSLTGSAANSAPPVASAVFYVENNSGQAPRGINGATFTANTNGTDPAACFEISGNALALIGDHCERFGVNFDVARYGSALLSSKGLTFASNDCGIGAWNCFYFHSNSRLSATVTGGWITNVPPGNGSFLRDDNINATCAAGTTLLTDNGSAAPGIGLYSISTSSGSTIRYSSDIGAANCFGVGAATQRIANGTAAMNTSAISSGACATVVTVSATGVATTDAITTAFNGDPSAVTGYGASATGAVLTIYPYPTANNVNFKVCNSTASSITPSALTLNWTVMR